nr:hypothetical protein [Dietzia sp. KRD202]
MRINEQVVPVTGGARGLGVEIIRAFLRVGALVVVDYRRSEAAADLDRELGEGRPDSRRPDSRRADSRRADSRRADSRRAVALRADVTDDDDDGDEVRALSDRRPAAAGDPHLGGLRLAAA